MNTKLVRMVGTLEGISFLVLLLIAMPMKYIWGNPLAVKYVGMAHGVLFLLFVGMLLFLCIKKQWSLRIFILGLIAAILPFGPFVFDHKLKQLDPH
ncbi:MAG: DUF3817 domain-containing protein [Acinetobacter populi]|jgi:integral membrane protein|uniref:DUF3817 domain-containing protein n=1 Tax=Acinetobacter populi TaxID=1582270 RepID=UPI0023554265|nr:DUF3817 domain-containing protein [Acinetobacter populi]MCH4247054.1 DUF3817 domain-containing protein [Acinetobacter populi]